MIKLSANETKWSSLLARTHAFILYISISIFDFGPEKLPGLKRPPEHKAEQDANFVRFRTRALFPIFPEESWVLEWIRIRKKKLEFKYGHVRTGKFLNPERKSCGFKNIRIPVDGALLFEGLLLCFTQIGGCCHRGLFSIRVISWLSSLFNLESQVFFFLVNQKPLQKYYFSRSE